MSGNLQEYLYETLRDNLIGTAGVGGDEIMGSNQA